MVRTVAPTKPRTAGALGNPLTPSPALAAVVGTEPLARTAVVSRLWDHIRAYGLQDPADKRTIIADDKLRPIFGKDRLTMFELSKVIGPHLTAS
jgi:DNA topoisomerase-3